MAWRPTHLLIEGELDNTIRNKITGYMKFLGLDKNIIFNLTGNFHRDIRGAIIRFHSNEYMDENEQEAKEYMNGFSLIQTGKAGDITAGLPTGKDDEGNLTYEYNSYPYIEFYSNDNGRVVLELDSDEIEFLSSPIPVCESDPIDRKEQRKNMTDFMSNLMKNLNNRQ